MEQHQVPQNIASYEFRLIGDMTLKQFFQVAAGGLIALAFYASPLPGIIKWPAILLFGALGIALAFLPLEERPLSTWILLFLKGIYSPTLYKRSTQKVGTIFAPETQNANLSAIAATPHGEEKAKKYLSTPTSTELVEGNLITSFEEKEENFLTKVVSIFHQVPLPAIPQRPQTNRPQIIVEEHVAERQNAGVKIPTPQTPRIEPMSPIANPPASQIMQPWQPETNQAVQTTQEQMAVYQAASAPLPVQTIPQPIQASPARFTISAGPPLAPQTPNVIVGQVVDEKGTGIESVILEIRDAQGRPARALRTNKVGHFMTATPLSPGTYQIIIDKDGYDFSPIQFATNDQIIPPIEISGKKVERETTQN